MSEQGQIQRQQQIREYLCRSPGQLVGFDLMIQFIERCIEDGKDATLFRHAAICIACGCSVDGKSNSPTATGGRSMPSLQEFNPFSLWSYFNV